MIPYDNKGYSELGVLSIGGRFVDGVPMEYGFLSYSNAYGQDLLILKASFKNKDFTLIELQEYINIIKCDIQFTFDTSINIDLSNADYRCFRALMIRYNRFKFNFNLFDFANDKVLHI